VNWVFEGRRILPQDVQFVVFNPVCRCKRTQVFNCIHRAHQNILEFAPNFLLLLLIHSLQYPLVVAALRATSEMAQIQYFRGYASGDASKQFSIGGFIFLPTYFGVLFCAICFDVH
jgi:glutathione S-transferase